MSEPTLKSESSPKTGSTHFECKVSDNAFMFNAKPIVDDALTALCHEICKATIDRVIPRVKQAIEDALAEEFGGKKKSEERKADEVYSLWRIDVVDEGCVGARRCKHSYAWSRSIDKARELFQHYYKNCHIDKIEEVFCGHPSHFLTSLDSDGTLRSLNVFILPPPD